MRYQAVIFDLFGTLINDFAASAGSVYTEMAAALAVSYEPFMTMWSQTLEMRIIGAFESVEANIEYVLNGLNARAGTGQIERAVDIRMRSIQRVLQPKPDAVSTLTELKTRGFKLGLISNASIEIPLLWQQTPFNGLIDEPIFSSRAHLKKPDIRIYHLACERLTVSPASCLYVGDGEDRELSGAAKASLHAVLIRSLRERETRKSHQDAEEWQGPTITRLPEVLQLL